MTPRVGLVAGYSSGRLLPSALRCRGLECVHIRPNEVPLRLLRTFNREDYCAEVCETSDNNSLVAELQALALVDVIPGSEIGVPLAWKLRKHMFSAQVDRIEPFFDKWFQTEKLREAGLRATLQGRFSDANAAIDWARSRALAEVVAKPPASTGSDNVFLCKEPYENSLVHAFSMIYGQTNELVRTNAFVLVQERLYGDEYVVDLVSAGQEIRVAAIFKYGKKPANGADFIYHSMDSVTVADQATRSVVDFAIEATRHLLGPKFASTTAVHMELIGECVVEAGFRTHGGQGAIIGGEVSGIGQIEMFADAIANRDKFHRYTKYPELTATAREVFLVSSSSGRLKGFGQFTEVDGANQATVGLRGRLRKFGYQRGEVFTLRGTLTNAGDLRLGRFIGGCIK